MKWQLSGGHLIDPHNHIDGLADLCFAEGRIVSVGAPPTGFMPDRQIDATGLVICPGLVDLAARLREPGYEYKASLESELNAALAGGVTTLVCPPDTDPPLDEPGLVEMLKHRARSLQQTHVYPLGAMTAGLKGEQLTEMAELAEAGCIAFSQAEMPVTDTQVLWRAMQYAKSFGFALWLRAQDPFVGRSGVAASGPTASRLGLAGVPVQAETLALQTFFELQRATSVRLHICRVSSAAGIDLIRRAKAEGLPVSCDVSIHHLHLIDVDIGYFDANCRLSPPLRADRDRDALRAALADGTIDALCSDHTPVDEEAKLRPFGEAEAGATGLELLLSLAVKWAIDTRQPLATAISRITTDPARIIGCDAGHLSIGASADICLFDPAAYREISMQGLHSQGKHTPFLGYTVPTQVHATWVGGDLAYADALFN